MLAGSVHGTKCISRRQEWIVPQVPRVPTDKRPWYTARMSTALPSLPVPHQFSLTLAETIPATLVADQSNFQALAAEWPSLTGNRSSSFLGSSLNYRVGWDATEKSRQELPCIRNSVAVIPPPDVSCQWCINLRGLVAIHKPNECSWCD